MKSPSIICLVALITLLSQGHANPQLQNLQLALQKYDTFISDNTTLEGHLHFPEVEKILPVFYKQLYERVTIYASLSNNGLEIRPEGKSEELKKLVKEQFLRIEDDLKSAFQQMIENDPIYRLKRIQKKPQEYQAQIIKAKASSEFSFILKSKSDTKVQHSVMFEISSTGKLSRMVIVEKRGVLEMEFQSKSINNKLYFTELILTHRRHGISKSRKVEIEYSTKSGIRYPSSFTLTNIDSRGRPIFASGHLNPIKLIFGSVRVLKR